jgi:hypothetical protein
MSANHLTETKVTIEDQDAGLFANYGQFPQRVDPAPFSPSDILYDPNDAM